MHNRFCHEGSKPPSFRKSLLSLTVSFHVLQNRSAMYVLCCFTLSNRLVKICMHITIYFFIWFHGANALTYFHCVTINIIGTEFAKNNRTYFQEEDIHKAQIADRTSRCVQ